MCGRFALEASPEEIAAHFDLADLADFPPRYNIAPTQPVLLVMAGPPRAPGSNLPDRISLLVRWGFIPGWAKDPKALPLLHNARAETVIEKPAFRAAMRHRRALIPASGYYEWRRDGKHSQPYWIRPITGGVIAFAALMETYADANGSEIDTVAILTTGAGIDTRFIHDRSPVVIAPEHHARWLDCRTREPRDVADLLRPAPEGFFEAIPISDKVNAVRNTGPGIRERVTAVTSDEPRLQEAGAGPRQLKLL